MRYFSLIIAATIIAFTGSSTISAQQRNLLGNREIVQSGADINGNTVWGFRKPNVRRVPARKATPPAMVATPTPEPQPSILFLAADKQDASPGETTTLRYRVLDAKAVELVDDAGKIISRQDNFPQWGDAKFTPSHGNTIVTLIATGAGGRVEKQLTIATPNNDTKTWPSPWWLLLIGLPILAIAGSILGLYYLIQRVASNLQHHLRSSMANFNRELISNTQDLIGLMAELRSKKNADESKPKEHNKEEDRDAQGVRITTCTGPVFIHCLTAENTTIREGK